MAGGGKNVVLDSEMSARLRDYQERRREGKFRELFNTTHEEFLDIPRAEVNWLLLIDGSLNEGWVEKAKRDAS